MSQPPSEYTNAEEALTTFRRKVLSDMVGGRVKAILAAEHISVQKFGEKIDSLLITPYMFSVIKGKALALRLNDKDVGLGEIHQSRIDFVIGKASYPSGDNPVVAPRSLPQVDVFQYTPPSNIELIEKVNEQVWANLFVLQTEINKFRETTDATNVQNDYFKFRAIGRGKVDITLSSPKAEMGNWNRITGEATKLARDLTLSVNGTLQSYEIWVIVDGNFHGVDGTMGVVPLAMLILSSNSSLAEEILSAGGKHVKTTDVGLYATWTMGSTEGGWTKTHDAYTVVSDELMWANSSELTLSVNDDALGSISPLAGTYSKKATENVVVTATANGTNAVVAWELDGVQYPTSPTFTVKCHENHSLVCVFGSASDLIVRPNGVGSVTGLQPNGIGDNWTYVDEALSDGFNTRVYNSHLGTWKRDLYAVPQASLPDPTTIISVTFLARIARYGTSVACQSAICFKTNEVIVDGDLVDFADWNWHVIEKTYGQNPVTKLPWTPTEVKLLQIGVRLNRVFAVGWNQETGFYCTQVWMVIRHHEDA